MSMFKKCSFEDALRELGISGWKITGTCNLIDDFKNNFYKQIDDDNFTQDESLFGFTFNDVENKQQELQNAEPLRELREERNRRIALTDWRFRSDLSPSQEWKDYSQALRDLPANYSPTFDIVTEDGYPLVKEDNTTPWPEEPTDG